MMFKYALMAAGLGLFLLGCCDKSQAPYARELHDAEEHFLRIQPARALEILNRLSSKPDLPERYFRLRYQVELRAFQFSQSFKTILSWRKKSSKSHENVVRKVLRSFIRYCTELKEPGLRLEAIRALGELKDFDAREHLMGLFPGGSQSTRITACYSMSLLGDEKRALPYLKDRSRFAGLKGRFLASLYLVQLHTKDLVPAYIDLLSDPDDAVRGLAIKVLGELGAKEARERLQVIFKDSASIHVKLLAAQALIRAGESSYKSYLLKKMDEKASSAAVKILLSELGSIDHLDELKSTLDSLDVEARYSVLKVLMDMNEKEFVRTKLREMLQSLLGNAFEKKMALELLSTFKNKEDWDLIQAQFFSPFQEVQVMAARAMLEFLAETKN